MEYTKFEETELLSRLRNGDQQAFELLFYAYKDKLLGFLMRVTDSVEESEDIVQDVFMKLWIDRENTGEIKNLNAYIFKIAQNRMVDNIRKFSNEKIYLSEIHADIEDFNMRPDDLFLKKERQLIFQEAVNQLSFQQKRIYLSHSEEGKSLKDIATEMNLSLSTVQNHMNRALKNLRNYFGKNYPVLTVVLSPLSELFSQNI
jgi:RNA polymerase sigma-70 factor (ECF subfamily)